MSDPIRWYDYLDEVIRLRAEVASLKEERDGVIETFNRQLMKDNALLGARVGELTQQLAAANGRVGKYLAGLVCIAEHYTDTSLAAKHMAAHARALLSPTGDSRDYSRDAALSNLNEDGKA
jgi:hypothetical protein